jgi:hypothetical protein
MGWVGLEGKRLRMDVKEIASKLWGWERERMLFIASASKPWECISVAPSKAVRLKLVQQEVVVNDTTGTAELTWRATDLGRQVASELGGE